MIFNYQNSIVDSVTDCELWVLFAGQSTGRRQSRGRRGVGGGDSAGDEAQTKEGDNIILVAADAECSHP